MPLQIEVQLFGPEAKAAAQNRLTVTLAEDPPTCGALRKAVIAAEPALKPFMAHWRIAVNQSFARDEQTLSQNDEVALIGMVSGG